MLKNESQCLILVLNRPAGGLSSHKMPFAHPHDPMEELADIVRELKPTVLIGAAAIPNVFTPEIIKDMASFNASPVIFALSNPTSKAECTAEQASVQYATTNSGVLLAQSSSLTKSLEQQSFHKSVVKKQTITFFCRLTSTLRAELSLPLAPLSPPSKALAKLLNQARETTLTFSQEQGWRNDTQVNTVHVEISPFQPGGDLCGDPPHLRRSLSLRCRGSCRPCWGRGYCCWKVNLHACSISLNAN